MTKCIKTFLFLLSLTLSSHAIASKVAHGDQFNQKIIYEEINAYRSAHGLSPLTLSPIISEEAKSHSIAMADNSVPFGHDGFKNRMHDLFREFSHARGIAENVAYGDEDRNSHELVAMWLRSPGHLRNIVGNYNLTGIGLARDANGRVFATQIFLRAGVKL